MMDSRLSRYATMVTIIIISSVILQVNGQTIITKSFSNYGTIKFPSIETLLWKAEFETNDLSEFSSITVTPGNVIETTNLEKHNGSYSMHIEKVEDASTVKGIYTLESAIYDFHFSFAIKFSDFTNTNWVRFFELRSSIGGQKLIYMDPNYIYFINGQTSKFSIFDNEWHHFNLYGSSSACGSVIITLDDTTIAEYIGEINWSDVFGEPYQLGSIEIGIMYEGGTSYGNIFFDDMKLETWTPPPAQPKPPVAEFIHYPTTPSPGEMVTFFSKNYSSDIDGNIVTYNWLFPNNILYSNDTITHTFNQEGIHDITLTVVDDQGLHSTVTRKILVTNREPVQVVGGWDLPLKVNGTQILDAKNNDIVKNLTGVSKQGIEYTTSWREGNPAYYEFDFQNMMDWGIKLNRVPFNWYDYMTDYKYREIIRTFVENSTSRGMLVIMDMHHYGFRGWDGQLPQSIGISKELAWLLGRDAIFSLKCVAHDFLYNPMVIGVEINEYRPRFPAEDPNYEYLFDFELTAELADTVHQINPSLLIGIELGWGGGGVTITQYVGVREQCKILSEEKSFVYMPHCYFVHNFGRKYVWDMYESGDLIAGKAEMYRVLDTYYLSEQNYYHFPVIVTEFGGTGYNGGYIVNDEFDYFMNNNWGSCYWAWFRQSITNTGDPIDMGLLQNDWITPSYSGEAYYNKLLEYGFN